MNVAEVFAIIPGAYGMLGVLLALRRVLFGPPIDNLSLLAGLVISGLLLSAAVFLATVRPRNEK